VFKPPQFLGNKTTVPFGDFHSSGFASSVLTDTESDSLSDRLIEATVLNDVLIDWDAEIDWLMELETEAANKAFSDI
jgi:hypothetical protein